MSNLYYTCVAPNIVKFKVVKIYNYELGKIDLEIANSFNKKNIHSALDSADFKILRRNRLMNEVIKLTCHKLGLGDVLINKVEMDKYLIINNEKYYLVFFSIGQLPYVNIDTEKSIVFLYSNDFTKVYYCGKKNKLKQEEYVLVNNKPVLTNFNEFY